MLGEDFFLSKNNSKLKSTIFGSFSTKKCSHFFASKNKNKKVRVFFQTGLERHKRHKRHKRRASPTTSASESSSSSPSTEARGVQVSRLAFSRQNAVRTTTSTRFHRLHIFSKTPNQLFLAFSFASVTVLFYFSFLQLFFRHKRPEFVRIRIFSVQIS